MKNELPKDVENQKEYSVQDRILMIIAMLESQGYYIQIANNTIANQEPFARALKQSELFNDLIFVENWSARFNAALVNAAHSGTLEVVDDRLQFSAGFEMALGDLSQKLPQDVFEKGAEIAISILESETENLETN